MKKCNNCGVLIQNHRKFCSKKCYGRNKKNKSLKLSKDYLLEEYVNKRKELLDISKECNCAISTIFRYLKKYEIPNRGCYVDFTDQKIGKLLAISPIFSFANKSGKHVKWLCKCDCGKEYITWSNTLSSCKNISCDTCRIEKRISNEEITDYIFGQIKRGAIKRKIEFNVTKEYVYNLFLEQNRKCKLTNKELCFGNTANLHKTGNSTASLDRIDSSKGYIEGNLQWVHKVINLMKLTLSQNDFIEWCNLVANHNKI